MMMMNNQWLTVQQVVAMLSGNVSEAKILRLYRSGQLPGRRIGGKRGRVLFLLKDVEKFLKSDNLKE